MPPVSRSPARTLAYAHIVANQNGIGTGVTDVAGLSITLTPGARPVWVEVNLPYVVLNTAAGQPSVYLTDSANNQVVLWANTMAIAAVTNVRMKRRLTFLTPGTPITFKVRAQAPAGATFDVRANVDAIPSVVGGPAWLMAYEEP